MKNKKRIQNILTDPKFKDDKPIPLKKPNRKIRPTFKAKFQSKCPLCDEQINKGDSVRFDLDGDVTHSIHKKNPEDRDILSTKGQDFCLQCHLTGVLDNSGLCIDCKEM